MRVMSSPSCPGPNFDTIMPGTVQRITLPFSALVGYLIHQ
jgi:hypothetical protein